MKVVLQDQFDVHLNQTEEILELRAAYFGVPLTKKKNEDVTPNKDVRDVHLAIYRIMERMGKISTKDQIRDVWPDLEVVSNRYLAVPSLKRVR